MLNAKDLRWLRMCVAGAAEFSTCSKRQYMSIIADRHGHVVGIGYNGGPARFPHCSDGGCPRALNGTPSGSAYGDCIAIHAESNALLHSDYTARRDGCTLYVNGPPCFWCAKLIANGGVKRVVHLEDDSYVGWPQVAAFLDNAGIEVLGVDPEDL